MGTVSDRAMRLDVIDDSGMRALALLEAHHTERMLDEVLPPSLTPSVPIATGSG